MTIERRLLGLSKPVGDSTYAKGGGAALVITGPALVLANGAALPSGAEYVWNKTNGAGTLLDIITGVAA